MKNLTWEEIISHPSPKDVTIEVTDENIANLIRMLTVSGKGAAQ